MEFNFLLSVVAGAIAGYGIFEFLPNIILAVAGGFIITVIMTESPVLGMIAYIATEFLFIGRVTEYSGGVVIIAIIAALLKMRREKTI